MQVTALEIQTQQLQTILNKRANDSRAAIAASDDVMAQVGYLLLGLHAASSSLAWSIQLQG